MSQYFLTTITILPGVSLLSHNSPLHGRSHIARVMALAVRLVKSAGQPQLELPLWAAVFLHDVARQHDGFCPLHGQWAVEKWQASPEIQDILDRAGVQASDHPMIATAVVNHCRAEIPASHPHYELTALLKDADALDRARLGDLDPRFLRHPEALTMIDFAEELYQRTAHFDHLAPDLLELVWAEAERLNSELCAQ